MTFHAHRHARAVHATPASRRIAVLTFSCALTVAVVMGMQAAVHWHLKKAGLGFEPVIRATESFRQLIGIGIEEGPPTPSVFEQELAMRPLRLLNRWDPFVSEAARRFHLPESWIKAVMREESGGRTVQAGDQPITSDAGALGLMQVMPGTYQEMRLQYGLGADPSDPHDNVIAGAAYLRWLYRKYGFPNMFAAYNDGPGKLDDHLQNGAPLPDETINYIAGITRILGRGHARTELAELESPGPHRMTITIAD